MICQHRSSQRYQRSAAGELGDLEEDTLRLLAEIRQSIAGTVSGAIGVSAVRAALLQLFESFTVHRWDSPDAPRQIYATLAFASSPTASYVVEPTPRAQAIEAYQPHIQGFTHPEAAPVLRRMPLRTTQNNKYNGLLT